MRPTGPESHPGAREQSAGDDRDGQSLWSWPGSSAWPRPEGRRLHRRAGRFTARTRPIRPANFVDKIDNRYLPLEPGTAFHFRGYSGKSVQTDDMVVTRQTKRILGIRCTVVRDTVSEHGKPVERTFDWYAQDKQGYVWYLGEDSLELKNGRFVRASDSWQSGVKGAKPGIIMQGSPRPGDVYRQEYYPPAGALDQARVLDALWGAETRSSCRGELVLVDEAAE
jgi:hypothetical protein